MEADTVRITQGQHSRITSIASLLHVRGYWVPGVLAKILFGLENLGPILEWSGGVTISSPPPLAVVTGGSERGHFSKFGC